MPQDKTDLEALLAEGYEQLSFRSENPHVKTFARMMDNDMGVSIAVYNSETNKVMSRTAYGPYMLKMLVSLIEFVEEKKNG